nr:PREDICTED: uncharacterized protein LOC105674340 isoform X1 [Linepithema humile]
MACIIRFDLASLTVISCLGSRFGYLFSTVKMDITSTSKSKTNDEVEEENTVCDTNLPAILNGKYFKIIKVDQDRSKVKAMCLTCKKQNKQIVLSGSLRATTNFKMHLKRVHKSILKEYDQYKIETKIKGPRETRKHKTDTDDTDTSKLKQMKLFDPRRQNISQQKKIEENILRYIVGSMKPLSTVDDPNFIKIFADINSDLEIPSRRTLGRRIDDDYNRTVEHLKQTLQNVNYISTTADIWSTKHKSFIGVTAHWITQDLKRCSCVLDCRRFKGTHSYDRIAEMLLDIFSEYGLKHEQIVSTITDNGSNFVKAFAEFGITHDNLSIDAVDNSDEEEEETIEFVIISDESNSAKYQISTPYLSMNLISNNNNILLPHHLRCASHTLNLLATTDFHNALKNSTASRIHHPLFGKCTALWNASQRPKTSEIIHDALGCSLTYPCSTRWNSLYDATIQLLKYKTKLNDLNSNLNLCAFKEIELEYLEEFCLLMKPIATALDYLQKETDCFYGQLLPILFSLKQRLQNLQEQNLQHTGFVLSNLLTSLHKRFAKFFELSPEVNEAIIASCFHPSFKLKWLSENLESERRRIQNLCVNSMETMETSMSEQATSPTSDTDKDFFIFSCPKTEKQQSQQQLEFVSFLNDKSKSLSSLNNYPSVKKLFIRFNTSLCSSAAVERLFSFAGFIQSPSRRSLSDKCFQKLIFLKGNHTYLNKNV